jgi:general secretion pathway protein I
VRAARGFTLVEILVALTLFAVVGGTLLQLFQSGLRTARLADAHTHAVLLARSKLTELQVHHHLQPGTLSGSFRDGYRWQAELTESPITDEGAPNWLQPLDLFLTISWGDPGDERELTLHSLLLTQKVES